jgi:hypothetical protein
MHIRNEIDNHIRQGRKVGEKSGTNLLQDATEVFSSSGRGKSWEALGHSRP